MIFLSAILLGFLSSWHCLGMCGPLVMAVHQGNGSWTHHLSYHAGRIGTYAVLGVIIGLLGWATLLLDLQKYFAFLLAGAVLILIFKQSWLNQITAKYQSSRFMKWVRQNLFSSNNFNTFYGKFFAGIANGLLPCGMVYVAMAGALAQPEIKEAVLYMTMFGVGTIPALLSFNLIPRSFIQRPLFKKWAYMGMLIISCIIFYRALNTPVLPDKGADDPFREIPLCTSL